MSRNDPWVRVHDMLDHAREAVEMASGRTLDELASTRMLNLAMTRLVEVIGEAASRVPDDFRARYEEVPWRMIADSRNRLIHGYSTIDLRVLWDIVQDDLPPLIGQLEAVIAKPE